MDTSLLNCQSSTQPVLGVPVDTGATSLDEAKLLSSGAVVLMVGNRQISICLSGVLFFNKSDEWKMG